MILNLKNKIFIILYLLIFILAGSAFGITDDINTAGILNATAESYSLSYSVRSLPLTTLRFEGSPSYILYPGTFVPEALPKVAPSTPSTTVATPAASTPTPVPAPTPTVATPAASTPTPAATTAATPAAATVTLTPAATTAAIPAATTITSTPAAITVASTPAPASPNIEYGNIVQSTDGSGTITINLKIKDTLSNQCSLNTFEYSTNEGTSWMSPQNGDNSRSLPAGWINNNGNYYKPGTNYSFTFNTKHPDVADLNNFEGEIKIRYKVSDGTNNSPAIVSNNVKIDNCAPLVVLKPDLSNNAKGGETFVRVDCKFLESNPDKNTLYVALNGQEYSEGVNVDLLTSEIDGGKLTPSSYLVTKSIDVGRKLKGNEYINKIKIINKDSFGNTLTNENTEPNIAYRYVIPYTPSAPQLLNATHNSLDLKIIKYPDEADELEYSIFETATGKYVQTNGILAATPVWQTTAKWATLTIKNLNSPVTQYKFAVKSTNTSDPQRKTESSLSSISIADTTIPVINLKINNERVINNDIIPSLPIIEAQISDNEKIDSNSIKVIINNQEVSSPTITKKDDNNYTVSYKVVSALSETASHTIAVEAKDSAQNKGKEELKGLTVKSGEVQVVGNPLSNPNPFKPAFGQTASISYTLSSDADITIFMYSETAQLIWKRTFSAGTAGGKVGYNEVDWDGKSDSGQVASNGVYTYRISSGGKVISSGRLVILD